MADAVRSSESKNESPGQGSAVRALGEWRGAVASCPPPNKPPIVVVALQNRFWMEWAIFAAHRIYAQGYRPIVLYSREEVDRAYRWARQSGDEDAGFWHEALACDYLLFVDVDAEEDTSGIAPYDGLAARRAPIVTAYALGIEEGEGEALGDRYRQVYARATSALCQMGPQIETALARCRPLRVVCPSGIIGWSVAVMEASRRVACPAVFVETFEMRPGHLVWNVDRPAVDIDVEGWLKVAGAWDAEKERDAAALAAVQERRTTQRDEWLDDFKVFQRRRKSGRLPKRIETFLTRYPRSVLAGPNIVADSTTIGRATIFRSQQEWIRELIAFFQRRPDLGLIIRAHPAEATDQPHCRIGVLAPQLAGATPNILVIDGSEPVSTYAVVDRCVLGLIWVSDLGVDMVIRGRPVLLAAAARYAPLGICSTANSREEYFELLDRLAANPPLVDVDTIQRAKLYQWIVFKRMSLRATSSGFRTSEYQLTPGWMHPDQEIFYGILTGERSDKGLPVRTSTT